MGQRQEGIETIRELQAFAPGIPIIAMSGGGNYSSALDLLKVAKRLGATLSMEKPFTAAQLLETVREALRGGTPEPV